MKVDLSVQPAFAALPAPDLFNCELTRALLEATALLVRAVKLAAPTPPPLTRASIGSFITEIPDGLLGVVGSAQPHVEYVELGTRPHFPPLEPIQDWVRVKFGISEQSEVEAAARAIALTPAGEGCCCC